jgi:hypothetical protein
MIRPRRLDYRYVKVYTAKPKKPAATDSYVVVGGKDVKLTCGEFKTRIRKGVELMPIFNKTLPAQLGSIVKNYVKKHNIKNGEFLFYNFKHDNMFDDSAFSKQIAKASKKVLDVNLTANDFRHTYMDFIADHFQEYNDNDLKQIAYEMGDMNVYTALKYRIAKKKKEMDTVTEINKRIVEERENEINRLVREEEEGSRKGGDEMNEEDSVDMPLNDPDGVDELELDDVMDRTTLPLPMPTVDTGDKETLYRRLAELEVEKMKIMVELLKM